MRFRIWTPFAIALVVTLLVTAKPAGAQSQTVKLDSPDIQVVLDELFGTDTSDGLLEGTKHFELRAEGLVLTGEQADMFFTPSTANTSDLSDLIQKAEAIKGSNLRIEGSVDGDPFELRLSGKQAKVEGLVLTQAEFDALVAELKTLPGLHEAKIEATVDGERLVAKLQNVPGRVKIEHHGFTDEGPHPVPLTQQRTGNKPEARLELAERDKHPEHSARPEKLERPEKVEKPERPEKIERPEKVERLERPEKIERVERPVKVERIERPEVAQGGKGRG